MSTSAARPMLLPSSVSRALHTAADRLSRLAYAPASGRDLRFDFLRGMAVFAMLVDHLAGPSRLYLLTGGNRFYTSAAEAFVFISGVVVGMAYRAIAQREGASVAM